MKAQQGQKQSFSCPKQLVPLVIRAKQPSLDLDGQGTRPCPLLCRVMHQQTPPAFDCSAEDPDPLMDACLLHCLNHVTTAASRIKKNNERLKANPEEEVPRDQGFTRPKVSWHNKDDRSRLAQQYALFQACA